MLLMYSFKYSDKILMKPFDMFTNWGEEKNKEMIKRTSF